MKQEQVIQNFLCSMDVNSNKNDHIFNAISDSLSYCWNRETLQEILRGIEQAYRKKKSV